MKPTLVGSLLVLGLLVVAPPPASAQVVAGYDRYGYYRVGYDPYAAAYVPPRTSFYSPGTSFYAAYSSPVIYRSSYYTPAYSSPFAPTYSTPSYYYGGITVPSSVPVYYRGSFYPAYPALYPTYSGGYYPGYLYPGCPNP